MEVKSRLKASGLNMTKIAKAVGVKRGTVSCCVSAAEYGDTLAGAIILGAAQIAAAKLGLDGIQTGLEDFTG